MKEENASGWKRRDSTEGIYECIKTGRQIDDKRDKKAGTVSE